MRQLPSSVRILGVDFRVVIVPGLVGETGEKLDGCIRYGECEIRIDSRLNEQMAWVTFIHEVLHGVAVLANHEVAEQTIDAMAHGLFGVIRNSKELEQWIK